MDRLGRGTRAQRKGLSGTYLLAGRGDWILCQITSKPYADPRAVRLDEAAFATGGLQLTSQWLANL